ncbi:type II toxin-antitoxin system HicA family toxin [Flavobacteriaceae bacterium]|jgi:predicted RNA binding protein YcfA (HicA-like mRNA interferase family)|nr:type II toxin-antitoxin system HicA family toxin [Flavobacteriaceae bacterium]MDB4058930.1 type II toxin-antitoxin system HicA family toxin [Flavobacteriaceae bacterium]MDB4068136.1 type II toxin-antitoxin system HicA family toxin [Flavobacteriaceae bacterium]MDB4329969.1 type II toxin-antitoxin system HicA family toxin [Flavobacteriaceae bacterium]|tara:strand:- start:1142 stop:1330 length:189 start_codon:yes stop_codon:yes gene_type:complete
MKSGALMKLIKEEGWQLVRIRGSHHHYKHPSRSGLVTVPHPKKDIPIGTVKSILKQAGIKIS